MVLLFATPTIPPQTMTLSYDMPSSQAYNYVVAGLELPK